MKQSGLRRAAAFSVHLLTAFGAAIGLIALIAAAERRWTAMFAWLAFALLIDALDGPLARRLKTGDRLPRWSGDVLDLVVDFLNYVMVPAFAIATAGLLPPLFAVPVAVAIVISSAIYFADRGMKTEDAHFRGFPATWNLVAFYMFLLRPEPWIAMAATLFLVALTFAPITFVHPLRVNRRRPLNVALGLLWAVLGIYVLVRNFAPPQWVVYALVAIVIYFLLAGFGRKTSQGAT